MKDVLEEIVAWKRIEVSRMKEQLPEREIHARVERMLGGHVPSMKAALTASGSGIIAEFKRKSPSKGYRWHISRTVPQPSAYSPTKGFSAVATASSARRWTQG